MKADNAHCPITTVQYMMSGVVCVHLCCGCYVIEKE